MKPVRNFWLLCALPALPCLMAQERPVVIRGATILTISGSPIPNGSITLFRGKILAVGGDVTLPPRAEVIDGTGKYIMPGLVDAMPALAAADPNQPGDPFTPQHRAIDSFHPAGVTNGMTTMYLAAAGGAVIKGQGVVVKAGGGDPASLIVREPAAIDMTLGEPAKLRQWLTRAQEYNRNPGQPDLGMEVLARLFKLDIPARIQANTAGEILNALNLAQEYNLGVIICGGAAAYEHRKELASRMIPVILPPGDKDLAAKLWGAGILTAIASFSHLSATPGDSMKWPLPGMMDSRGSGLTEAQLLQSVTLAPAQILGVSQRLGTLDVGKDADVIVLDGPPLSPKTSIERLYAGGELLIGQATAVGPH